MAGRNFFPARAASCSRCASRSSRNFRNMIQVRSGSRSRSPFRPLSLRMMSRADLSSDPSAWAVVAATGGAFALGGIELGLELGHRGAQLVRVTEQIDDLGHGAMPGERRHPQHVGQEELGVAVLGVLFQQLLEHLAGLRAVAIEEVLARLAKALRPLAPGAQRSVEGQVAEEIEGIGLGLAGDLAELGEVDAALLQLLDDL